MKLRTPPRAGFGFLEHKPNWRSIEIAGPECEEIVKEKFYLTLLGNVVLFNCAKEVGTEVRGPKRTGGAGCATRKGCKSPKEGGKSKHVKS